VVKGTLLSLSHRGPEAATGVIIGKLANRKEAASRGVKAKGFQLEEKKAQGIFSP
jgi:hypothetical protein